MLNPAASPEALLGPQYAGKTFYRGKITSPTPPPPRSYWPAKRERYYFYKTVEGDSWVSINRKIGLTISERKRFMKLNTLATHGVNRHALLPVGTTLFLDLDFSELMEWPPEFLMNILLPRQATESFWWEVYRICTQQSKSLDESMRNLGTTDEETNRLMRVVWDVYEFLYIQYKKTQEIPRHQNELQEPPRKRYRQTPEEPLGSQHYKANFFMKRLEEPLQPIEKAAKAKQSDVIETERVQLSSGRCVIVDAQRISPFRTLFCHHCNKKFSARPSQRRPQSAFVLNHACSGQKRTQFVIGKRHRRCDFGCSLKVGCIKFVDE